MGDQLHLLAYSHTTLFGNNKATAAARLLLEQLAADHSWFVYATDNAAVFNNASLSEFDVVIFANADQERLSAEQRANLRVFEQVGGTVLTLPACSPQTCKDQALRKRIAQLIRKRTAESQKGSDPRVRANS